jgi:hypothetical protein
LKPGRRIAEELNGRKKFQKKSQKDTIAEDIREALKTNSQAIQTLAEILKDMKNSGMSNASADASGASGQQQGGVETRTAISEHVTTVSSS